MSTTGRINRTAAELAPSDFNTDDLRNLVLLLSTDRVTEIARAKSEAFLAELGVSNYIAALQLADVIDRRRADV